MDVEEWRNEMLRMPVLMLVICVINIYDPFFLFSMHLAAVCLFPLAGSW